MTGTIVAQLFVVLTLVLMIIGKTPMYVTAVVGSTLAALFAGIPLFGSAPVTIKSLLIGGLNPVLIDMGGILLFIGIMQSTGFLHVPLDSMRKTVQPAFSEAQMRRAYSHTAGDGKQRKCLVHTTRIPRHRMQGL